MRHKHTVDAMAAAEHQANVGGRAPGFVSAKSSTNVREQEPLVAAPAQTNEDEIQISDDEDD